MRYIDPKTGGNDPDEAHCEKAPVDESRRRFIGGLAALFATSLLSACDKSGEIDPEVVVDNSTPMNPENEIASKNDIGQIRTMLIAKYPN